MTAFTPLELTALASIFSETPALTEGLQCQLANASVVSRENTGGGFFTYITVADEAPPVDCPRVLGYETHAHIDGLPLGLGFVLFTQDGKLSLLDTHAWAEDTSSLDPAALVFEVYRQPQRTIRPKSPF